MAEAEVRRAKPRRGGRDAAAVRRERSLWNLEELVEPLQLL